MIIVRKEQLSNFIFPVINFFCMSVYQFSDYMRQCFYTLHFHFSLIPLTYPVIYCLWFSHFDTKSSVRLCFFLNIFCGAFFLSRLLGKTYLAAQQFTFPKTEAHSNFSSLYSKIQASWYDSLFFYLAIHTLIV